MVRKMLFVLSALILSACGSEKSLEGDWLAKEASRGDQKQELKEENSKILSFKGDKATMKSTNVFRFDDECMNQRTFKREGDKIIFPETELCEALQTTILDHKDDSLKLKMVGGVDVVFSKISEEKAKALLK